MARYSFNRSTDTGEATPSETTPAFTAAERQNSLNRFNSVVEGLTTVFGATRVNDLILHYDNFYNFIPPFGQDAPTTDPPLNLTNELIFPDLADGANFNLPQATHLNRFQVRDAYGWALGKHTLHLGGEFQNYTANGEAQLPWRFTLAPLYTFGSGVPADTFLPGTVINGASGSRLLQHPNNLLYRKTSSSLAKSLGLFQAGSCQNTNRLLGLVFA
jgi:hypothetical protein